MMNITWYDFYKFNLRLAYKQLGSVRGWKRLVNGLEYTKCIEYPFAFNNLELKEGDTLLDIGSRASLFPLFASSRGIRVWAIDINARVLRLNEDAVKLGISQNFTAEIQDARNLSYPDNYFSVVTLLSSVEHIQGDGDTKAIIEASRVLRLGGKAIIIVPFGYSGEEGGPLHFFRTYDKESLQKRLIGPSSLEVVKLLFYAELKHEFWGYWRKLHYFRVPLLWMQPMFVKLFSEILDEEKLSSLPPPEKENFMKTAGTLLVLEKKPS